MRPCILRLLPAGILLWGVLSAAALGDFASPLQVDTRPSQPELERLPPRDRIAVLISRLPKHYANVEGTPEFKQVAAGQLGLAQVKWLCSLPRDKGQPWAGWWHDVLPLLYTARAMPKASREVKDFVRDASDRACDRIRRPRTKADAWASGVRKSEWSCVVGALCHFGDPGLLTPAFWRTLEAQDFRDGGVLAVHGDEAVARKLEGIKAQLASNERLAAHVGALARRVRLAVEHPQIKQVTPRYLYSALEHLAQIPRGMRKAWIARHIASMRKRLAEDERDLKKWLAEHPPTHPATKAPLPLRLEMAVVLNTSPLTLALRATNISKEPQSVKQFRTRGNRIAITWPNGKTEKDYWTGTIGKSIIIKSGETKEWRYKPSLSVLRAPGVYRLRWELGKQLSSEMLLLRETQTRTRKGPATQRAPGKR